MCIRYWIYNRYIKNCSLKSYNLQTRIQYANTILFLESFEKTDEKGLKIFVQTVVSLKIVIIYTKVTVSSVN